MQWRAAVVMAAVAIVAGPACTSTGASPTTFRRPGRLPPVPGPTRSESLTIVVGSSVVVIGGSRHGPPDGVSEFGGGFMLDGDSSSWSRLDGPLEPMVNLAAAIGADSAVVVGTRCRITSAEFYEERGESFEDVQRCGAQPVRAYLVEEGNPTARRISDPPVAPPGTSIGPTFIHGVGVLRGRYYFSFDQRSPDRRKVSYLMSVDRDGRDWRRVRSYGGDGAWECISGRRLVAIAHGSDDVVATYSPATERWTPRPGAGAVPEYHVITGSVLVQCPRGGRVIVGRPVDAQSPSRRASFSELGPTFRPRSLPEAPYGTPLWTALTLGTSTVLWERGSTGHYLVLRRGAEEWEMRERPPHSFGTVQPYSPSSVLTAGDQTSSTRSTMAVVRVR